MKRNINKMETWQIANYLTFKRGVLLATWVSRESIQDTFMHKFSDKEWKEFINFCISQTDLINETELLIDKWRSMQTNSKNNENGPILLNNHKF